MKKTIAILLALSGLAMATSVDYSSLVVTDGLVYANSFNSGTTSSTTFAVPNVNTLGFKTNAAFSLNATDETGTTSDSNHHPWLTGTSQLQSGFTLSFDYLGTTSEKYWKALANICSNGTNGGASSDLQLLTSSATNVTLYAYNFAGSSNNNAFLYLGDVVGKTITLTYNGSDTITGYVDGVLKGSITLTFAEGSTASGLDNINLQFGQLYNVSDESSGRYISATYDNVYIWNKALSAADVKSIVTPEPATATLSLLALAGLAARRRRK